MIDRELWELKFQGASEMYREGKMSRAMFLAFLHRLGFRGRTLEDELQYQENLMATAADHLLPKIPPLP